MKDDVNTVLKLLFVLASVSLPLSNSKAWSPASGAEQAAFNRYVYESLVYIPQTPIKDSWGNTVGWSGPTLQQQLASESNRQMNNARNQANAVNAQNQRNMTNQTVNPLDGKARSVNDMKGSIRVVGEGNNKRAVITDPRVQAIGQSKAAAAQNLAEAKAMVPDGPSNQERSRLANRRTAGGQLDANQDGVITKNERLAALRNRPSMRSEKFIDPNSGIKERKLDANGNGTIENYGGPGSGGEWETGLQNVAGTTVLDHNAMIAQRKIDDEDYETPKVNENNTFTDASGNVVRNDSLHNTSARARELQRTRVLAGVAAAKAENPPTRNDLMGMAKGAGVGSGRVPNQVTSSSRVTTGGTWGRTYTDSKTYNVAADSARSQSGFAQQLGNKINEGINDAQLRALNKEAEIRRSIPN
jgi:hypothetical protein